MQFREWALALVPALAAIIVALTCSAQTTPAPVEATRVVHVFVALCDNKNQGIVPVPVALGNGQDPKSNLYWGAQFGADTFFRRSEHWRPLAATGELKPPLLARSVFESKGGGAKVIVVMDAYDGADMKQALTDFLRSAAGAASGAIDVTDGPKRELIAAWGSSHLVAFVGHNGLMDVRLDAFPEHQAAAPQPKAAVVLACKSNAFFREPLRKANCAPLVTTAQLMAPEAYTLDAVIRSWAAGDSPATTRERAAAAYAKYQKISLPAARGVFVAGWGE